MTNLFSAHKKKKTLENFLRPFCPMRTQEKTDIYKPEKDKRFSVHLGSKLIQADSGSIHPKHVRRFPEYHQGFNYTVPRIVLTFHKVWPITVSILTHTSPSSSTSGLFLNNPICGIMRNK